MKILFWISLFLIYWAMIGYPVFLLILSKLIKRENKSDLDYEPTVTVMIVAHNEEKVIEDKLKNVTSINYPKEKLKIIVTSDNSTDNTNKIVEGFIEQSFYNITLYKVKERKGKTNAQNEAQKLVKTDILVMTDANAMLERDSIKELVSYFVDKDIVYVCGQLQYIEAEENHIANSESNYWNLEMKLRKIESNIQTITAGNGSLYAVRNEEYIHFNPMKSHDSSMPLIYALKNKRALFNENAVSYEKASSNSKDEFQRKVRMNRIILSSILPSLEILNIFRCKWFTLFYLSHRTARYTLWLNHTILLLASAFLYNKFFYKYMLIFQIGFYSMGLLNYYFKLENRFVNHIYYYCLTILAQFKGVYNTMMGLNKPFWEKSKTTR